MTDLGTDKIFTEDALLVLADAQKSAESAEHFLEIADELATRDQFVLPLDSPIEFDSQLEPYDPKNYRRIIEAVGPLDRLNASDPRLWSYLAIVTCREYMNGRWGLDETGKNFRSTISQHWLMTNASARQINRNGIGQLWWISTLTWDPDLLHPWSAETKNPFAYTEWVMESESRRSEIFERDFSWEPKILWSTLEAVTAPEHRDTLRRQELRILAREINLVSGYRRIEELSTEELNKLILNLLEYAKRENVKQQQRTRSLVTGE